MRDKILYIIGAVAIDSAGARHLPDHRLSAGTQSGHDLQDHLLPRADGDYGADLRPGGLLASILFLVTKNFKFDALAVAVTEVGLAFLAGNLITGSIWGRVAWGIWWAWDARLTSALVCWLLYAGYLMLRQAIEEPTQRATFAAVFSIFAFIDVPIVIFSIKWWRTQHPQPVFWGGGSMPPTGSRCGRGTCSP